MNQRQRIAIIRKLIKLASIIDEDSFFIFENGEYEYADTELGGHENVACNNILKSKYLLQFLLENNKINEEQFNRFYDERPYAIFCDFFEQDLKLFKSFLQQYPIQGYSFDDYQSLGFSLYFMKNKKAIRVLNEDFHPILFNLYNLNDNHIKNICSFIKNKVPNVSLTDLKKQKCIIEDMRNKRAINLSMADLLTCSKVKDLLNVANY